MSKIGQRERAGIHFIDAASAKQTSSVTGRQCCARRGSQKRRVNFKVAIEAAAILHVREITTCTK
jgi:hypothetical protein